MNNSKAGIKRAGDVIAEVKSQKDIAVSDKEVRDIVKYSLDLRYRPLK